MLRLQLLLRSEHRNPAGVRTVKAILRSMGVQPTASGSATVSAEIKDQSVESVFGSTPLLLGSQAGALAVPKQLSGHVEGISIAPEHEYMDPSEGS